MREPLLQHGPRKANVPPNTNARQFARAYRVVDPGGLDRQEGSGLLGRKSGPSRGLIGGTM